MTDYQNINYHRIEQAIDYIKTHFKDQPSLNTIAEDVGLSTFHFQRLFTEWAGVSPKQFMQFISIEHAKQLLKEQETILDTSYKTGFSGTSRLHDLFIKIEGMTPGEYKNGGENLSIKYNFTESPFGDVIVASTTKGLCHMSFENNEEHAFLKLKARFPNANYHRTMDSLHKSALAIFQDDSSLYGNHIDKIKLHLKGSDFQLKVWQALLAIPSSKLTSYGDIAQQINKPKSYRAVGTAVGNNPIAFLIPCHRVIKGDGNIGGYMWGESRKLAIIGWEASRNKP